MLLHVIRRTAILVASLAVSSVVVFGFMVLLPGDPARVALGVNASEEAVAQLRAEFGLDQPLVVQYFSWVSGLVRFDLGRSYVSQVEIAPQILDRLQVTLWLVVCAMILAVVIAVPLGTLMAIRHRRPSGFVLTGLSQLGVAVPAFLAGILLITVFAVRLGWLPANGWTPPNEDPIQFLRQLVLPVLSLGLVQGAVLSRYVRSSILDVQREDYIRTARAKGLGPFRALWRHGSPPYRSSPCSPSSWRRCSSVRSSSSASSSSRVSGVSCSTRSRTGTSSSCRTSSCCSSSPSCWSTSSWTCSTW